MKNNFDLHFRPLFKLPASSNVLWILFKFINFVSLISSAYSTNLSFNQTHQLSHSFDQTYQKNVNNSVVEQFDRLNQFNPSVFLKRINNDHQADESSSSLSADQVNYRSTSANYQADYRTSSIPLTSASNHQTFSHSDTNYHQAVPFGHSANQPASANYQTSYQSPPLDYPVSLAADQSNYQSLRASVHNRIKSNIRQHNNRKYVNSRRREDRQTDDERADEEKYSTEYNDEENKKSDAIDYDIDQPTRAAEEESKQQNEKTDYKTDYDTEDYHHKQNDRNTNRGSKESNKDHRRDSDSRDSSRDYDERKAEEDSMHMSDEDGPTRDDPKDDEDSVNEGIKEDDFKDNDTFKNEDEPFKGGGDAKDSADSQNAMKKDSVAIRFQPIPKYSKPFSPKKEWPKYESFDDPMEGSKHKSKKFGESSMDDIFGEKTKALDEKSKVFGEKDKDGFGERSKFSMDDEKASNHQKANSKEVNYSVFGLNPINLEEKSKSISANNFERHEELLIELLKRRFLNKQQRLLELNKREKRRKFLSDIDESFSLKELNEEVAKYAAVEGKLNQLISLIQKQQNPRELTRFSSSPVNDPVFGQLWPLDDGGRSLKPPRKSNRSKARANLFGSNGHLFPLNRLPLSHPNMGSWSTVANSQLNNQANNYVTKSSNTFQHRMPAASYSPNYPTGHPQGYSPSYSQDYRSSNDINSAGYQPSSTYLSTLKTSLPASFNAKSSYVSGGFASNGESGSPYSGTYSSSFGDSSYSSSNKSPYSGSYIDAYNSGVYHNALASALSSVINNPNLLGYPNPNYVSVKRYPIYKFIRPIEQPAEQATSGRKLNPLNERLNALSGLFGGGADKNYANNQTKTSDLISSILQSAPDSTGFRKLAPTKYQYRLMQRLSPSIPLRRLIHDDR